MLSKRVYQFVLLNRDIFSRCPLIWGSISKTTNVFWNFLGSTYWLYLIRKKDTRNFCLFVYLRSYNDRSKFSLFLKIVQSSRNTSYLQTSHFLCKMLASFFSSKRFCKWNLKHTPQSPLNSFSRKWNLKFCIVFNMISLSNAQASVKIRLACLKVLILWITQYYSLIGGAAWYNTEQLFLTRAKSRRNKNIYSRVTRLKLANKWEQIKGILRLGSSNKKLK